MHDIVVIKQILQDIKERMILSEISEWTNSTYSEISEAVFAKTGVLLSRNTLKNMVAKVLENELSFTPQNSTRQALVHFLDYADWNDYKQKNIQLFTEPVHEATDDLPVSSKNYSGAVIIILVISALIAVFFVIANKPKLNRDAGYSFSLNDSVGYAPHTFTINYDFSQIKDSVFVDFDVYSAAGRYEYKQISNDKGLLNFCYYNPGKYTITVYIAHKPVKTFNVLILSNGWVAKVYNAEDEKVEKPDALVPFRAMWPRYIRFDNIINQGFINESEMEVKEDFVKTLSNIRKNYKTEFSVFQEFEIDGDNIDFMVNFFNKKFGIENYCYSAGFELIGTERNLTFDIMQPGCKIYARYWLSDQYKDGFSNNLTNFEHSFLLPRTVKMEIRNKALKLYLDDKSFFNCKYNASVGKIIGIVLTFKGSATVNWIELKDAKSGKYFRDDFH